MSGGEWLDKEEAEYWAFVEEVAKRVHNRPHWQKGAIDRLGRVPPPLPKSRQVEMTARYEGREFISVYAGVFRLESIHGASCLQRCRNVYGIEPEVPNGQ